jgi:hypothetical protein
MTDKFSRRAILLQVPVAGALFVALSGCGQKSGDSAGTSASAGGTVCANLSAMTDAEQGTRKALNYMEASPNPSQVCAGCSFFHAGGGTCGTCDMFSGGPVNSHGHCNSWSAKG